MTKKTKRHKHIGLMKEMLELHQAVGTALPLSVMKSARAYMLRKSAEINDPWFPLRPWRRFCW